MTAKSRASHATLVRLRIGPGDTGIVAHVAASAPVKKLAAKWMYILRNRSRWSDDEDLKAEIATDAKTDLEQLGITEAALKRVNASPSRHVEVEIVDEHASGDRSTEAAHAASSFPWEFVIAADTSELGSSEALVLT